LKIAGNGVFYEVFLPLKGLINSLHIVKTWCWFLTIVRHPSSSRSFLSLWTMWWGDTRCSLHFNRADCQPQQKSLTPAPPSLHRSGQFPMQMSCAQPCASPQRLLQIQLWLIMSWQLQCWLTYTDWHNH